LGRPKGKEAGQGSGRENPETPAGSKDQEEEMTSQGE
jgi:hypothetical protein